MKLYKFCHVDTNKLASLADNTLWCSQLEKFNDPFEGEYQLNRNDFSDADIIRATEASMLIEKRNCTPKKWIKIQSKINKQGINSERLKKHVINQATFTFEQSLQECKDYNATCFISNRIQSEVNSEPLENNLMWSHYADGLRGFCLAFDYESLYENFSENNAFIAAIPVKYNNSVPILSPIEFIISFVFSSDKSESIKYILTSISSKSKHWEYENEWRFFSSNSNTLQYKPSSLEQLIIGSKMPKDQQALVISVARAANPDIEVKLAKLIKGTYKIEIVDYIN